MTISSGPIIGITTKRLSTSIIPDYPKSLQSLTLDGVVSSYAASVAGAGGIPILIPRSADVTALVGRLDGIVLSGGEDVSPSLYGATVGPNATAHDPERDEFELSLIRSALSRGVPILAICRGIQILNVACGGTLVEHLPDDDGFSHMATDEPPHSRRQGVTVDVKSSLAGVICRDAHPAGELNVNSFHHQAIKVPGDGLRVVAWAMDGTIEGVENDEASVIGVQWHPELHEGVDPLFPWLVSQATRYAATSGNGVRQ